MAYDSAREKVILFGGIGYGSSYNNETWEWDGTGWAKKTSATSPTSQYSHAMAYDSVRGKVVLFGGSAGVNTYNDETWEWDGTSWAKKTPADPEGDGNPSARYWHAMAYDSARGKVVLFGGSTDSGSNNETWEWNGTSWTKKTPTDPEGDGNPSARYSHAMAYDSARGKVVLFGGYAGGYNGQTWEWDGTSWALKTPTDPEGDGNPSARGRHAMAYDSARGKVVLFGGGTSIVNNETWEWDGASWAKKTSADPENDGNPTARAGHAMAYDSVRGKVVLFGGYNTDSGYNNETWEFDSGVSAYPAQLMKTIFSVSGETPDSAAILSFSADFTAGGTGYTGTGCGAVNGSKMMIWNTAYKSGAWMEVASNTAGSSAVDNLEFSTTDPDLISHLFFGDEQSINVAVVPVSANGCGTDMGSVAVDYAEVIVKYSISE